MFKDLLHNLKNRFFGADSRWLDERAIAALTTAVKNGERGHGGELRLVIERRPLPGDTPLQTRAERHFSTLGLWNTEDRSALLIYLNLAASQLYILADNGVLAVIPQNIWDDLAARTLRQFKAGGAGQPHRRQRRALAPTLWQTRRPARQRTARQPRHHRINRRGCDKKAAGMMAGMLRFIRNYIHSRSSPCANPSPPTCPANRSSA